MRTDPAPLTIDADGEARAIGAGSIAGPWQLPAEIVRHLLRRGAGGIDVRFRRGRCVVEPRGGGFSEDDLQLLVAALDRRAGAEQRLRAISDVELRGLHPVLAVARISGGAVWARPAAGDGGVILAAGGDARRVAIAARGTPPGGAVVRGRGVAGRTARTWLCSVAAFAPVDVLVQGRRVSGPLRDGVFRVRLAGPPPVQLAVGSATRAPHLWLLQHGIVSTRASVPGWPPFAATVELGERLPPTVTAADLRRAVTPFLPMMISAAVATVRSVADRLPQLPDTARRRLTRMLLVAAARGIDREAVMACPLVPRVRQGRVDWVTPHQVQAERRPGSPVRMSREEASLLHELTGVDVDLAVEPRAGPGRLIADRIRWAWSELLRGRSLAESELAVEERALLAAAAAEDVDLRYHGGRAPATRSDGVLWVGRRNRRAGAAARLVARRPDALYPVLAALDPDPTALSPRLAERWAKAEEAAAGRLSATRGDRPAV